MARRRRKTQGAEGHNSSERWLLTYSDMITLLMAFFIMMYSMSVLNLAKFNEVAISIRSGFGGVLHGGDHLLNTPAGEPTLVNLNPMGTTKTSREQQEMRSQSKSRSRFTEAQQRLVSYVITHNLVDKVSLVRDARGVIVTVLADGMLFPGGSAELNPESTALLAQIADMIRQVPNKVMVEGHSCNLPISSAQYPSNWELSSARASSVVRFLIQQNIPGNRLAAVGYADTQPRVPNTDAAHRAANRRVDIVILSDIYTPGQLPVVPTPTTEQGVDLGKIKPVIEKVWPIHANKGTK